MIWDRPKTTYITHKLILILLIFPTPANSKRILELREIEPTMMPVQPTINQNSKVLNSVSIFYTNPIEHKLRDIRGPIRIRNSNSMCLLDIQKQTVSSSPEGYSSKICLECVYIQLNEVLSNSEEKLHILCEKMNLWKFYHVRQIIDKHWEKERAKYRTLGEAGRNIQKKSEEQLFTITFCFLPLK